MGSISIREHIRWGSDTPSEPTSTLVLTSPGRRFFVDVRILKTALEQLTDTCQAPRDGLEGSQIDWAFGGVSASTQITRDVGSQVSHSTFRHWVDSRTTEPEKVADEGDMFPGLVDGTTLETGRMVNPATGMETDYEELWRDEEPLPVEGLAHCLVSQLHDDEEQKRGLFVQLGQYAQGVLRIGQLFTAERWEWNRAVSRWDLSLKAGNMEAPSLGRLLVDAGKDCHEGDTIHDHSGVWTVIEKCG